MFKIFKYLLTMLFLISIIMITIPYKNELLIRRLNLW